MSLINEALKRAKEAQEKAPSPALSAAHLRPVEPTSATLHSGGLLLPVVLTLVALGGLFFLWRSAQSNGSGKSASAVPQPAVSATERQMAASTPPPAPAPAAPTQAAAVAGNATPRMPVANATSTNAAASGTLTNASTATNLAALAPPPLPKPAPLRLQAIVFNPVRPSAMISGKTLFVGDRLGEFRVLAITQGSATLAGATRTNVLTLSE